MNTRWLTPVLALTVAGVLAYSLAQRTRCGRPAPAVDPWQDVSALTRELHLTGEQARQAEQLQAELGTQVMDCCARHCAARARLPGALAAATNNSPEAEALVTDMARAYEESERATLAHLRRLRSLLTPDQRGRFDALVTESLSGACNMPGAQPPNRCGLMP